MPKEALLVIAQETFRDEEYAQPKQVLESSGVSVMTASILPGVCTGKLGMVATADISLRDALGQPWDAVAFIGGAGARAYFDDTDAHALARETAERGAVLGGICIAPSVLAHAGLLAGRRATSFESQQEDLVAHGAEWVESDVVVDGLIVTANGPLAATGFGEAIAELLAASEPAER